MVFVLDINRKPLSPCHEAVARKMLKQGKAAIFKKYNKDRFSALAYVLWYIKNYEDNIYQPEVDKLEMLLRYSYI